MDLNTFGVVFQHCLDNKKIDVEELIQNFKNYCRYRIVNVEFLETVGIPNEDFKRIMDKLIIKNTITLPMFIELVHAGYYKMSKMHELLEF